MVNKDCGQVAGAETIRAYRQLTEAFSLQEHVNDSFGLLLLFLSSSKPFEIPEEIDLQTLAWSEQINKVDHSWEFD